VRISTWRGRTFIYAAGKDSVLAGWLASLPPSARPHRVRRAITRGGAHPSEDHEALDEASFRAAQVAGAFAFVWHAHGLHYGVRWSELAPLAGGRWVVMNGSRAHLDELRAVAARATVLEVVAPDAVREARLWERAREAGTHVTARMARQVPDARPELRVVNDGDLAAAVAQVDAWWHRLAAQAPSP
jgi:phosphonate metabolism protein PhnN/1,5-bisphosphokinase (PRPP-forming)